ncbi:thiamine phosphate synthase [Lachnobacterium bovis]|uniref:Thiamine-phosphate pyrophosphorylase n=1 Tax=Lachnobacterium bovis TaxID=140626 RepID=A0A1H9R312_9FIRM|nr:thiamine phosphate synthase [Lachnobacterium bovis]SER66363.1 thiamine-phosphate pyrophosphorylase [Lachnobacterium bovis]
MLNMDIKNRKKQITKIQSEKTKYQDTIFVTNRKLVKGEFLERIKYIVSFKPKAILLREKDLSEEEYKKLAIEVQKICQQNEVQLIIHNFINVALELGVRNIHFSHDKLEKIIDEKMDLSFFKNIGTSCHHLEEEKKAETIGVNYIFVGHIFRTNCKKNLEPRGIKFLKEMVQNSSVNVWAIGGIDIDERKKQMCLQTGAKGVCIMSYAMQQNL